MESDKIHNDQESRLRKVERDQDDFKGKYAVIAALTVIILSGLVSWLVNVVTENYNTSATQTITTRPGYPTVTSNSTTTQSP